MAINAVRLGANTLLELQLSAQERTDWRRAYLHQENGTPSHDTFAHLSGLIDPDEPETVFRRWASGVFQAGAPMP